jgi:hypothetical protein
VTFENVVLRKTLEPKKKETGGKQSIIFPVDTMNWYTRSKCLTPLTHDVGSRWRKCWDVGENYIKRDFIILIPGQILLRRFYQGG